MTIRVAIAYNFNDSDWLGGRNYFGSLLTAFAALAPDDIELVLVVGETTQTSLPEAFPWLEVLRTPLMSRMHPSWLLRQFTLRMLDCDPLLERYLVHHRIDILTHSMHLGARSRVAALPWLCDFQFMHLPEYWEPKQIRWSRQRYEAACRQGTGVIVSSRDALADLECFAPWCTLPKHVLRFVSNPVSFDRLPARDELLSRLSLPANYFYLPNQFWSNKNHRLAIDALALLKAQGVEATIACTGRTFDGRKPQFFDELMAYCRERGVEDRFKVLGIVPYVELQGLMAYACGVINPSRFEGWSTTVEEAKTFHQRLLLSDLPVHREQAPRFGRFFSPDDPAALATHMRDCLAEGPRPIDPVAIAADYDVRLKTFGQCFADMLRGAKAMQRT